MPEKTKAIVLTGLLLLVSGLLPACGSGSSDTPDGPYMIYFFAQWWPVCKEMTPIVNGLEETYGEEFTIMRVDIDTAQGKKLAREHGFIGQPTFMFFNSAGDRVRNLMGPQTPETLAQAVEGALSR